MIERGLRHLTIGVQRRAKRVRCNDGLCGGARDVAPRRERAENRREVRVGGRDHAATTGMGWHVVHEAGDEPDDGAMTKVPPHNDMEFSGEAFHQGVVDAKDDALDAAEPTSKRAESAATT